MFVSLIAPMKNVRKQFSHNILQSDSIILKLPTSWRYCKQSVFNTEAWPACSAVVYSILFCNSAPQSCSTNVCSANICSAILRFIPALQSYSAMQTSALQSCSAVEISISSESAPGAYLVMSVLHKVTLRRALVR